MNQTVIPLISIILTGLCGCAALNPPPLPEEPKEVTSPPLAPDRTWVAPVKNSGGPVNQIKPSATDANWNSKKPPMTPDRGWIAPVDSSTAVTQ